MSDISEPFQISIKIVDPHYSWDHHKGKVYESDTIKVLFAVINRTVTYVDSNYGMFGCARQFNNFIQRLNTEERDNLTQIRLGLFEGTALPLSDNDVAFAGVFRNLTLFELSHVHYPMSSWCHKTKPDPKMTKDALKKYILDNPLDGVHLNCFTEDEAVDWGNHISLNVSDDCIIRIIFPWMKHPYMTTDDDEIYVEFQRVEDFKGALRSTIDQQIKAHLGPWPYNHPIDPGKTGFYADRVRAYVTGER